MRILYHVIHRRFSPPDEIWRPWTSGEVSKFLAKIGMLPICEGIVKLSFLGNALSKHRMLDIYGLSIERADRGRHVLAIRCCIGSEVGNFNPAAAFWQLSVRAIY